MTTTAGPATPPTNTALVLVDVQGDFCEGGKLAVAGGAALAARLGPLSARYTVVVATRDRHVDPGHHFAGPEGPDWVSSFPEHCLEGSAGAELHPDLDQRHIQAVFDKGRFAPAFSGFEGRNDEGVALAAYLRERGVTHLDICGIATDYCVAATATDALAEGFATAVLTGYCVGVDPANSAAALARLAQAGATLAPASIDTEAPGA